MMSSEDRYERALGKADADRLVRDAQAEARAVEMRKILDVWASSLVHRLNPILDDADFGKGTTQYSLEYDNDTNATLTYQRTHNRLHLLIKTSAQLVESGILLVGEDHREVENTASMSVTLYRSDTNEERTAIYRYGLQPASKVTSINQDAFTRFVLGLLAEFGSTD